MRQLGEQGERRVVVMLGAPDWRGAQEAAARFDASVAAAHAGLRRAGDGSVATQSLDFYRPWRDALLTDGQRASCARRTPHPWPRRRWSGCTA